MTKRMNERVDSPGPSAHRPKPGSTPLIVRGPPLSTPAPEQSSRAAEPLVWMRSRMGAVRSSARQDTPKHHAFCLHQVSWAPLSPQCDFSPRSLGSFNTRHFHLAFYLSFVPCNNLQGRPCIPHLSSQGSQSPESLPFSQGLYS